MLSLMIATSCVAFFATLFSLFYMHPRAIQRGFVDRADHRKLHTGNIPLVGGPAIYFSVMSALLVHHSAPQTLYYFIGGGILMLLGVVDDKRNLRVSLRLFTIMLITIFLFYYAQFRINFLGDLFNTGDIWLDNFALIFTVIAVLGAITAFNMVDGIDGLLGCLSIVTFASLAVLFALSGQIAICAISIAFITALLSFLVCNLDLLLGKKYKVFMGDSGSFFIGFSVICLLIIGTQLSSEQLLAGDQVVFKPVTALWIIAVPLMDMAANILRRLRKGQSPFMADRGHLHHILQRIGLSDMQVLIFITLLASIFAIIGILAEIYQVSEFIMVSAFVSLFIIYFYFYSHSWKLSTFIHRLFRNKTPQ